jgi:restriction system protein
MGLAMPIPDFQTIMLPFLELAAAEQEEITLQQAIAELAARFGLTPEERAELLPSGFQAKFTNRVAWAATHLRKAGLLERVSRGRYRLTERGQDLLATSPNQVTMAALSKYPEYLEFKSGAGKAAATSAVSESSQTPQELIEATALAIKQGLAQELLERVRSSSPEFFERLVIDLLVSMGYGGSRADAGRAVGRVGDEGIDGIIKEDRLGLDAVYVQAKRWTKTVGRPELQMFAGSLDGQRASKGVFLTTSTFSADARAYVAGIGKRIVLVDGNELAELMIDTGVGVASVSTYTIKRVDEDYFEPI